MFKAFRLLCVMAIALQVSANAILYPAQAKVNLTVVVSGTWYRDNTSTPLKRALVEVFDANFPVATLLGSAYTQNNGTFSVTINSTESDGPDIFMRVAATDNTCVKVTDATLVPGPQIWVKSSTNTWNNWTNSTLTFSPEIVSGQPWYLFDRITVKARDFLSQAVGYSCNANDLSVIWTSTNLYGPNYSVALKRIHMPNANGFDEDVLLHEFGHYIMHKLYGFYPNANCPDGHFWTQAANETCAFTEGWATYFSSAVSNDLLYTSSSSPTVSINIENYNLLTNLGSNVEGSIGASLWDISDLANANENWDHLNIAFSNIWNVLAGSTHPNTMTEFESIWLNNSAMTNDCGVMEIVARHEAGNPIQTQNYNLFPQGNKVREAFWRRDRGCSRDFTISGSTPNWSSPLTDWNDPPHQVSSLGSTTPPYVANGSIVSHNDTSDGTVLRQAAWRFNTSVNPPRMEGWLRTVPIDYANNTWGTPSAWATPPATLSNSAFNGTTPPSGENLQAQDNVLHDCNNTKTLYQIIWRNNQAYRRQSSPPTQNWTSWVNVTGEYPVPSPAGAFEASGSFIVGNKLYQKIWRNKQTWSREKTISGCTVPWGSDSWVGGRNPLTLP
jgi:hypothetical protein